jgi:transposase
VRAVHNDWRDGDDHDDTRTGTRGRVFDGVDTHKGVHVAAALDEMGRPLGTGSRTTTTAGYRQLWQGVRSWGEVAAVGMEGTGSWVRV